MSHTLADVQTAVGDLTLKVDGAIATLKQVQTELATALGQVGQLTPDQQTAIDAVFDGVNAASDKLTVAVAPPPAANTEPVANTEPAPSE